MTEARGAKRPGLRHAALCLLLILGGLAAAVVICLTNF
jgi:hypothetical protein